MARQYWRTPIPPFHTAAGAAYLSSVTLTDVSPTPQKVLPGYTLLEPNMELFVEAWGSFSNTGTPTLLLGVYYGGVAGVALAASAAITTTTGAASWPFHLEYHGKVVSVGSAGQMRGYGFLDLPTSLVVGSRRAIPETAAARLVTIDTTVAKAVTIGAQWSTSSASNTLTVDDIVVDILN
jgi:hypothetical protein